MARQQKVWHYFLLRNYEYIHEHVCPYAGVFTAKWKGGEKRNVLLFQTFALLWGLPSQSASCWGSRLPCLFFSCRTPQVGSRHTGLMEDCVSAQIRADQSQSNRHLGMDIWRKHWSEHRQTTRGFEGVTFQHRGLWSNGKDWPLFKEAFSQTMENNMRAPHSIVALDTVTYCSQKI